MKKNLRNVLVLGLGLITTIASAQMTVESKTRALQDSEDAVKQRISVAATWGGDDWSVHTSSDVHYDVNNDGTVAGYDIYEAYASTDVMGFGTLTVGRQDLSFGSGALISSNDWGLNRLTTDGVDFAANFGGFDINVGAFGRDRDNNYINAGGEFSGVSFNVLMLNEGDASAHGYDFGYGLMGGDLNLMYSMNSDFSENEMTMMGASYNVFENMSLSYTMTSYSEENTGTFSSANSAMNGGWDNGMLGYQAAGTDVTSIGLSYDLGGINLGYTMHTVTHGDHDDDASVISLGYSMSDNASISVDRFTYMDANDIEVESTWITLEIGM